MPPVMESVDMQQHVPSVTCINPCKFSVLQTYYERLQAEAEGQHGAPSRAETAHSRKSSEAATQGPMAAVRHTADSVVSQAQPIS